ncbi:hypothetical protein I5F12_09230 [Proteus cibarius]|uniref:hypothetical protein n=1 Tax=Proteus TaxID=583 RepID=UPI0018C641C0|nr:hypothetical protein [Proteus terrae]MBG6038251.1 hypothetical protein [Proteus terrae subsp. cibarius]
MKKNLNMVSISELSPGDILLCYKNEKFSPISKKIINITNSFYTHAAICFNSCIAAESNFLKGVAKIKIQDLANRYDHIAVFRQPDAWSPQRICVMNHFIDSLIKSKAKYNLLGVGKFKKNNLIHEQSLTNILNEFFNNTYVVPLIVKKSYFCSELVVNCFIKTGFIDPSAAVIYKADTISPGALGNDPTFGTFYGYISTKKNYSVPITDEFFKRSRFNEIFY